MRDIKLTFAERYIYLISKLWYRQIWSFYIKFWRFSVLFGMLKSSYPLSILIKQRVSSIAFREKCEPFILKKLMNWKQKISQNNLEIKRKWKIARIKTKMFLPVEIFRWWVWEFHFSFPIFSNFTLTIIWNKLQWFHFCRHDWNWMEK